MPYDIAVNITDAQYLGEYQGSEKHPCDIEHVVARAKAKEVKMVFLGTSFQSSVESAALAEAFGEYAVVGVHPLSSKECTAEDAAAIEEIAKQRTATGHESSIRQKVQAVIERTERKHKKRVIGVGEIGLDYYRGKESKSEQKKVFQTMLEIARKHALPCVFHYRECEEDFLDIAAEYRDVRGVVHSFTGSAEEMKQLVKMGYYIGINGLSIKESESTAVIEELPLERILVETDAPYCSLKKSSRYYESAGEYVAQRRKWSAEAGIRGRNEPANLHHVLDVVAEIKKIRKEDLAEITDKNFESLFGNRG